MSDDSRKTRSYRRFNIGDPRQPIVLVGLMGAGKSSIGKRLAARIGLPFIDSDSEVELAAGRSVAEIFEDYGEAAFRDGERRVIARLLDDGPSVIATGGGAFADPDTRRLIREKALSVWLDADIDILVERTARRDTRPLLKEGDPEQILRRLKAEREPCYREADIHVRSGEGPHEAVVARILDEIEDLVIEVEDQSSS